MRKENRAMLENVLNAGKEYISQIRNRKARLILAVIISAVLILLSGHYLFSGINKRFFLYMALSLLTGALFLFPRLKRWYLAVPLVVLYICFVPQKLFQRMELPVQDLNGLLKGADFVNVLIILLVYAVLLLLFQRTCYAFLGGNLFLLISMLLNYCNYQLRGSALTWFDLKEVGSLLLNLFRSGLTVSDELWYSILYFLFFSALGFWCDIPVKRGKEYHLTVTTVSVAFCFSFFIFCKFSGYIEDHGMQGFHSSTRYDEKLDGFLLGFALGISEMGEDGEWYEKHPVVCHALGSTEEGDPEGNYLEALEYNYNLGFRVFEADIQITSDHVAVLRHDWSMDLGQAQAFGWTEEEKPIPTAESFLEALIYGKYTPMLLADLYEIMEEREDIYVVLDPKYTPEMEEQFEVIVNTALDNGYESVLDRIIVQLYYEDMYEEVMQVYPFKNFIYTLYYIGWPGGASVGDFCEEKEIPVLVMPYTWISDNILKELEPYPWLKLYPHTLNDPGEAQRMLSLPVDGIYSANITPSQLIRWKYGTE